MEVENEKTGSVNESEKKENENVDEFQEYISQQKPANFVSVHKSAKRELGQYPGIFTSRLVNNIYTWVK